MDAIEQFEKLLDKGQDSALLRFSLASAYLKDNNASTAIRHFSEAVRRDPDYAAAWKLYGKALTQVEDNNAAINAYQQGIGAAQRCGNRQAEKEMQVFLRRLQRTDDSNPARPTLKQV